jgi:hypothetical protein
MTRKTDDEADSPSLEQRLASAMGDRHAEAIALARRAGDAVGADEAKTAVREAHGDIEAGTDGLGSEARSEGDLASPSDAENVRDRKSN